MTPHNDLHIQNLEYYWLISKGYINYLLLWKVVVCINYEKNIVETSLKWVKIWIKFKLIPLFFNLNNRFKTLSYLILKHKNTMQKLAENEEISAES